MADTVTTQHPTRAGRIEALKEYVNNPSTKSLLPRSVLEQITKTKKDTLGFDAKVSLGLAGRRGKPWADDPSALRIYVAKRFGGVLGDQLSPFHIVVPDGVLPAEFQAKPKKRKAINDQKEQEENSAELVSPYALELWWQSAKMKTGEGKVQYLKRRRRIYDAGVAKRTYYSLKTEGVQGAYFDGRLYQYLPSRLFYCEVYRRQTEQTQALAVLRHLHRVVGVNLLLVGPDGFPLEELPAAHPDQSLEYRAYCDLSLPFGHERVLLCLVSQDKASHYPWEMYKTQNSSKADDDKTKIVYPGWLL